MGNRIKVAFVGGHVRDGFGHVFGGTIMTTYCYLAAFKDDDEFELLHLPKACVKGVGDIEAFARGADILHVDDTQLAGRMYEAGMPPPDVIGPITRSPVKEYTGWTSPYSVPWFYRARVIRLNYAEERACPERVHLITHGLDTDMLKPSPGVKRYVLWAGDSKRPAKNYALWQEIQETCALPKGYVFKTMSGYHVQDYWKTLKHTALLVNTSLYETFCCAAFEALSCGIPVVWRENLQGGIWEDAGTRVEYTPEAYSKAIIRLLADRRERKHACRAARTYVESHVTLRHMRDSYAAVYRDVMDAKRKGTGL